MGRDPKGKKPIEKIVKLIIDDKIEETSTVPLSRYMKKKLNNTNENQKTQNKKDQIQHSSSCRHKENTTNSTDINIPQSSGFIQTMLERNDYIRSPLEPDPLSQIEIEPSDFSDYNLNSIPSEIDGKPKYDISTPFHLSTNDNKKQTENLNLPQNEADEERSSATTGFSFSNNVTLNSPPNNDVIFEGIEGESFGISQIEQFLNINHENYDLNIQKNNTVVEEYQHDQEHQQDQQQHQQDQSDFQEFDEEFW